MWLDAISIREKSRVFFFLLSFCQFQHLKPELWNNAAKNHTTCHLTAECGNVWKSTCSVCSCVQFSSKKEKKRQFDISENIHPLNFYNKALPFQNSSFYFSEHACFQISLYKVTNLKKKIIQPEKCKWWNLGGKKKRNGKISCGEVALEKSQVMFSGIPFLFSLSKTLYMLLNLFFFKSFKVFSFAPRKQQYEFTDDSA